MTSSTTTRTIMFSEFMVSIFDLLFTPYTIQVGALCATLQILLYIYFRSSTTTTTDYSASTTQPWSIMSSFTAHQIVTIPVLVYLSIQGVREMYIYTDIVFPSSTTTSALERITNYPQYKYLSEFVFGIMFFWDIPTGLCTSSLRELPMILHHIGMCFIATLSLGLFSNSIPLFGYYAPFYFGIIELSSLPLIIVDLYHPKHVIWNQYLTSPDRPKWMTTINDIARPLFAVLFIILRMIAFPYISIFGVLSDVITVASLPINERNHIPSLTPLYIMAVMNVSFSCLQFYWGTLLIRQIMKLLRPPKTTKATKSE